jgi:hypothetical protein
MPKPDIAAVVKTARVEPSFELRLSLLKTLFGLRIGWKAKFTTADIDDISSVEENVGHRL